MRIELPQFKTWLAIVALLAGVAGCGDKTQPVAQTAQPVRPGDAVAGKLVAERNCKGCHGLDGRGTAPGIPHLAAQIERYLLESVSEYREGKRTHAALRDMTANMSEVDVRNAVAYYASLPAIAAVAQAAQGLSPYDRGKALAAGCASCHGPDGNSTTPGTPTLAGQQPRYFVAALREYHAGDRHTSATRSMLRVGGQLEIESLALFFASQTPVKRAAPASGDAGAGEPLTAVCGGCHGSHGISTDASTPSLAGQDAQYLATSIKAYGKSRKHETMESQVSKLSDADVQNIAAFYASQTPRAAEKGHTLIQELADKCNRCHGDKVNNPSMAVPKISGQDKDYLVMALRAYRDDRRESSAMHRMSLPFSDAVIDSLAGLYASQPSR
jgi:cytochrome c553